jgi:hypothetical protein
MSTLDLRNTALSYAERGWPVFPCKPGGKTPVTPHGCLDATTDMIKLAGWWAKHPTCNIGIRTGEAFDVLDLDGDAGCDQFDSWCRAVGLDGPNGIHLEDLPTVCTPSGGFHLYWRVTGAGNRAGMIDGPGVDWRGRNGYVIAAGSVRPDGGYTWYSDPPELGDPPQALLDLVMPTPDTAERTIPAPRAVALAEHGDATRYGYVALEAEVRTVAAAVKGTRNHALNAAGFTIYQLVAGGEIVESVADSALSTAAQMAGLKDAEIAQTLASAKRAGFAQPRRRPDPK